MSISDANGRQVSVTSQATVADQVPVAVGDSYSVGQDGTLIVPASGSGPVGVLANDTDSDADPLTAQLMSGPSHGSLSLNSDGSFTYNPAIGYYGTDSFSYEDNNADSGDHGNVALAMILVNKAQVTEWKVWPGGQTQGDCTVTYAPNSTCRR